AREGRGAPRGRRRAGAGRAGGGGSSGAPAHPPRGRTPPAGAGAAGDGKPLPARERTRLFLHHKPRGRVPSHADPGGGPTVFAGLPKGLPRLISVGRLDLDTEGLLLLTTDPALPPALELPPTRSLRPYPVPA